MSKVVLGLSGGVDSSVSACLLQKAGHDVRGLYLETGAPGGAEAARAAAAFLNIPLEVADARGRLETCVCGPFASEYLRGGTPNPCVLCNPGVKFYHLLETADRLGAEYISTGHYARAEGGNIYKGRPKNDQSYMLCRLTKEQAGRLRLPLGGYEKDEVRAIARAAGLPSADSPDSMEICFIPGNNYGAWLEKRGGTPPPGNFVDKEGNIIGPHRGIHRYTIGQRKHFGVYAGHRIYVTGIRPETNEVVLGEDAELWKSELFAENMSWLSEPAGDTFRCSVRVRHSRRGEPGATAVKEGAGVRIVCDEPVRAPTRGQAAALYDDDLLLGGGFIA